MNIEFKEKNFQFASERKHITVLFSDLSGYTNMSENLDPEEIRDILSDIFKKISQIIVKYDGFIEKYIGDAVMAMFGVPKIHEDDPIRALYAAQEIHHLMKEINFKLKNKINRPLTMHTGINTGLVVTGEVNVDRGTHGVSGDTINLSARLSGLAEADQILIGPNTHKIVKEHFIFECLGPQKIKGKKNLITAHRLIKDSSVSINAYNLIYLSINSSIVGRDNEINIFCNCLNNLHGDSGNIITVTGRAGIGKSRFIAEIKNRSISSNFIWVEGRCLSYCQMTSFWPICIIVKTFANITEKDDDKSAWEKLNNSFSGIFEGKVDKILPYIACMLSIEGEGNFKENLKYLDAEAIRRQIFMALRSFFINLSKKGPLVIIFEDLQWCDQTSLELIEHIIPIIRNNPILICCVFRPKLENNSAYLLDIARKEFAVYYTSIELNSINETDSIQLIKNLLNTNNIPPKILQYIIRRAEGNPFFIEEIIRSLFDMEVIVRDEIKGCYVITQKINKITIPESLRGVIMARIDMLNEELRDVLKLASVIGRVFFYRVISDILHSENGLELKLTNLQAQNLIRVRRILPDIEYIFKHALTQEVTYESILLKQRRELHQIVGDCIETLFKDRNDDFVSMLAYHFTCAENWDKAQFYLFKAGDQAGKLAADSETLNHYKKAIAAYERVFGDKWDPFQRAVLERKIGEALFRKGHHQQAIEFFYRALSLLKVKPSNSIWIIRLSIVKHLCIQTSHRFILPFIKKIQSEKFDTELEEILNIFEMMGWIDFFMNRDRLLLHAIKGLNYAERKCYHSGIARGSMGLGLFYDMIGFHDFAENYHQRAILASKLTLNPIDVGHCHLGLAFHEDFKGCFRKAVKNYRKSAELFLKAGDMRKWGDPIIMIVFLLNYKGKFQASFNLSKKVKIVGENCGDQQLLGWGMQGQGLAYYHTGKLEKAEECLTKAVHLLETVSDYYGYGIAKKDLGLCYLKQGKVEKSIELLENTSQFFKLHRLKGHFVSFLRNALAEAYLVAHEKSDKELNHSIPKRIKKACRIAVKDGKRFCWAKPQAYRLNGIYYWHKCRYKTAMTWWKKSLEISSKLEAFYELKLTNNEISKRMKNTSL